MELPKVAKQKTGNKHNGDFNSCKYMAEALNDSIEKLRRKSKTLLARVSEDSKRVNAEVKKLHLQTLSLTNRYDHETLPNKYIGRNTDLWKLRNDSSGVNAVLCPDYFRISPKQSTTSVPDMISSGKLTLMCKRPKERSGILHRKPVKECYCCSEANKMQLRSSRTRHKPISACHCKSQVDFRSKPEIDDKLVLTSPLSCETFRRIQKIDYAPKSQFLRNVRSKIHSQNGGQGDCLQTCPRSASYHKFMGSARMQTIIPNEKIILSNNRDLINEKQESPSSLKVPANSLISEENICDCSKRVHNNSHQGIQVPSRKDSKSTLKKTITSKKQISEPSEKAASRKLSLSKKTTRLCKENCPCCCESDPGKITSLTVDKNKECSPKYCKRRSRYLKYDDDFVDQEVEDLRKFREQNYFDTHGSSNTLASSRSSGSLQQYLLNERLFPEPLQKIHKQDLVVTMPPCATMQRKRVHYFPRYVIEQEKNICNTTYRRKRYEMCPLTGHAIDLGILKIRPPLNSLALKYQKRTA